MKQCLLFTCSLLFILNSHAQGTWTQKADAPDCRYEGVSFSINGIIYYGLGTTCGGAENTEFFALDPSTNNWTQVSNFPGPTRRLSSGFAINGKGYVCMGYSQSSELNDLWEYDPIGDVWTQKADYAGSGRGAAIAEVVNNKGYVGLGLMPHIDPLYPLDIWAYDPTLDTWTEKNSMPDSVAARYNATSFAVADSIYIVGGIGGELLLPVSECWVYSTTSDTWFKKQNFSGGARTNASGISLNNRGYVGYGLSESGNCFGDFYEYTPATGQWVAIPSNGMGGQLFDQAVETADAGYFVSTGQSCGSTSPDVWEYHFNVGLTEQQTPTLTVFPNPSAGFITIDIDPNTVEAYVIYNSLGQVVRQEHFHPTTTLSFILPAGMYTLQTRCKNGQSMHCSLVVVEQ